MDDTSFFREQAERFRGQADASFDPLVKSTLESLSSGFADYARGLEERGLDQEVLHFGSQSAEVNVGPHLIAEDEAPLAGDDVDILADDGWAPQDDAATGPYGTSATKHWLFYVMLSMPSLGVMAWTVVRHGT